MSRLMEKINSDLKQSMMAKNAEETSVLRMLIAAARNKEIVLRDKGVAELTDEQALEVVSSEVKKRKDSIQAYLQGGRQDLADKEDSEIKILEKYLPEPMSDQELKKIIQEIMAAGADNFGKIMGQAMARVKGKADGAKVGEMVKKMLAK